MQDILDQIKKIAAPWQKKIHGLVSDMQDKLGKEHSIIGIDAGSGSIKAVQLADVNGVMTIVKSAIVDVEEDPKDDQAIIRSLKSAVDGMTTEGVKIVAIINSPETCTRKIIAPNMPKNELADAVQWEAKNAIPYSIEKGGMDYKVLGDVSVNGVKKLAVIVAAAPQEAVNKIIGLCTQAGLTLSALIPVSVSQQNLISSASEWKKDTFAVVEMGASVTELNIYANGKLDFSRKLPVSGNDITKSMTSTLMSQEGKVELTLAEAEKAKIEKGIPDSNDTESVDGKILSSQILSLVRPCIEQLANEIDRSFDFYREGSGGSRVSKIILFGGGANLKGLIEFLSAELEIEVIVGDSMMGVKALSGAMADGEKLGSRFNLAIGAALNKSDGINLLPAEFKEKTRRFIENISLQAVAVGIVVTLILVFIGLNIQLGSLNKKMEALRLEQRTTVPRLESQRSVIMANKILTEHPYWEDVMKEISHTIEQGMYLTEISMEDDTVRLKGIIIQSDLRAQSQLSNFMITLEEGIFRHVNLVTLKKESENAHISEFEITAEVD